MIVVNDFSGSKDDDFELLRSEWSKTPVVAAMLPNVKTGNRVDLLEEWEEYQTFLEILGLIEEFNIYSGTKLHPCLRRASLLIGEAQLAGCLKVLVGYQLKWDAGIQ